MLIELEKTEYAAFQEWKAASEKESQFDNERKKSLQPFSALMIRCINLFNGLCHSIQKSGNATSFVRVYGHIQCAQITIMNGGWHTNKGYDFDLTAYAHDDNFEYIQNIIREKVGELNILDPQELETILNQY